jgi:uncharacterized LabA/DUF88 family protein
MDRIAVFVDAGYLYAQGSVTISGQRQSRDRLILDTEQAIACLSDAAGECEPLCKLLRIYWYDGSIGGARPTSDQAALALMDNVKLRLGFVNNAGQQKGVDSLIVTDLIELARLGSITDALLLSGDEDVRVGVQIAQNYGVRVHLIGIKPVRGTQSLQLQYEADTTREWCERVIGRFLSMRSDPVAAVPGQLPEDGDASGFLSAAAIEAVASLGQVELDGLRAYWKTERGLPRELDAPLLKKASQAIGRKLLPEEVRKLRSEFQKSAKARLGA